MNTLYTQTNNHIVREEKVVEQQQEEELRQAELAAMIASIQSRGGSYLKRFWICRSGQQVYAMPNDTA
jgi:hypothetical protein